MPAIHCNSGLYASLWVLPGSLLPSDHHFSSSLGGGLAITVRFYKHVSRHLGLTVFSLNNCIFIPWLVPEDAHEFYEKYWLWLAAYYYIMLHGAGKISLDHLD